MRLVAANIRNRTRGQGGIPTSAWSVSVLAAGSPKIADGSGLISGCRASDWRVSVRRHLRNRKRVSSLTSTVAEIESVTEMEWDAPLEVGQGKGNAPVSTVSGPQKAKQRLVLVNGQYLAIAQGPALGSEIERNNPNFC